MVLLKLDTAATAAACKINDLCRKSVFVCMCVCVVDVVIDTDNDGYVGSDGVGVKMDSNKNNKTISPLSNISPNVFIDSMDYVHVSLTPSRSVEWATHE